MGHKHLYRKYIYLYEPHMNVYWSRVDLTSCRKNYIINELYIYRRGYNIKWIIERRGLILQTIFISLYSSVKCENETPIIIIRIFIFLSWPNVMLHVSQARKKNCSWKFSIHYKWIIEIQLAGPRLFKYPFSSLSSFIYILLALDQINFLFCSIIHTALHRVLHHHSNCDEKRTSFWHLCCFERFWI